MRLTYSRALVAPPSPLARITPPPSMSLRTQNRPSRRSTQSHGSSCTRPSRRSARPSPPHVESNALRSRPMLSHYSPTQSQNAANSSQRRMGLQTRVPFPSHGDGTGSTTTALAHTVPQRASPHGGLPSQTTRAQAAKGHQRLRTLACTRSSHSPLTLLSRSSLLSLSTPLRRSQPFVPRRLLCTSAALRRPPPHPPPQSSIFPFFKSPPLAGVFGVSCIESISAGKSPPPPPPPPPPVHLEIPDLRERFFSRRSRSM